MKHSFYKTIKGRFLLIVCSLIIVLSIGIIKHLLMLPFIIDWKIMSYIPQIPVFLFLPMILIRNCLTSIAMHSGARTIIPILSII